MQEYFVYILFSKSCNIYYIGHTNNLQDRIKRHNQNRNKFTKGKGSWELTASSICNSKSEAYQLELKLKSFKNSNYAIRYLKDLVQSTPI